MNHISNFKSAIALHYDGREKSDSRPTAQYSPGEPVLEKSSSKLVMA